MELFEYNGFNYKGYKSSAKDAVNAIYEPELYKKVFRDSLMPRILNELNVFEIASIIEIIKEDSLLFNGPIYVEDSKIENDLLTKNIIEISSFYTKNRLYFENIDSIYKNKVLSKRINEIPVLEYHDIYSLLKNTPSIHQLSNYDFNFQKIDTAINKLNIYETIDFYNNNKKYSPYIDSVFFTSVLPIVINTPYPILKDIKGKLSDSQYDSILSIYLLESKSEYINQIQEEIDFAKTVAYEAYDRAVEPMISFEIDSIAENQSKQLQKKFSGGFLEFRKISFIAGKKENKFQNLWKKYIKSEEYDGVFDKHIILFLKELLNNQDLFYYDFTGEKRNSSYKVDFMSEPIIIEFPLNKIQKITEYVASNKYSGILNIAELIPKIGDDIFFWRMHNEILNDIEEEKIDNDEQLRLLCQQLIIQQIGEEYYEKCRKKTFGIIEESYEHLFKEIIKQL